MTKLFDYPEMSKEELRKFMDIWHDLKRYFKEIIKGFVDRQDWKGLEPYKDILIKMKEMEAESGIK